jgi:hypothetical protein
MPEGLQKITLIGPSFVAPLAQKFRSDFIHEDELLDYKLCDVKAYLEKNSLPTKRAGWYFQQFIKLGYALRSDSLKYYIAWDSDTVLLRPIAVFEKGKPVFSMVKRVYHEGYFRTLRALLNIEKKIKPSFIAEYMVFDKNIVRELFEAICAYKKVSENEIFETILDAVKEGKDIEIEYGAAD